jgi:REP element-mobilizing transposase RayT
MRDGLGDVARRVSTNAMRNIAGRQSLLSIVIGGLKSSVTKYAHQHDIPFAWQTRFYDHIIRNQDELNMIATYIENNPANWKEDKFYMP